MKELDIDKITVAVKDPKIALKCPSYPHIDVSGKHIVIYLNDTENIYYSSYPKMWDVLGQINRRQPTKKEKELYIKYIKLLEL